MKGAVRQYRGGSSGVSIPIGLGMRYRTSSSRGRSVVVGTELVEEDQGQLTITSVRSVFVAPAKRWSFVTTNSSAWSSSETASV